MKKMLFLSISLLLLTLSTLAQTILVELSSKGVSPDASLLHKKTGIYIVGQLIHKVTAGLATNHRIGIGISKKL